MKEKVLPIITVLSQFMLLKQACNLLLPCIQLVNLSNRCFDLSTNHSFQVRHASGVNPQPTFILSLPACT